MRILMLLLTTIISQATYGQIINSVSPDKTGMIYYSVDSLIQKVEKGERFEGVVLIADCLIIQKFPEEIRNIPLIKLDKTKKYKTKNLSENHVLLRLHGLTIIRDEVTLTIWAYEKKDKRMTFFGDGVYVFYFKYLPETTTYKLTQIKSGFR